ncbi:DUF202 domain-containing protein [Blastococcus sp. URHD0036]|uniref:DUF202 domain-containing protein n=1 Tax=Blastococcus sp. URHD0036 TaxID=1380356 RepID=UPI0004969A00|nr:DUF202 domain-containing protein [Blastococcus sp. URHD0036]
MTEAPPGAQAERTSLAWRRTALGIAAGAVVAARLVAPSSGPWAWVVAGVGGLLAALLFRTARQRYRSTARVLAGEAPADVPGPGRPAALLAGLAAMLGVLACGYVLLGG